MAIISVLENHKGIVGGDSMNIFKLHNDIIEEYRNYVRSFHLISDEKSLNISKNS